MRPAAITRRGTARLRSDERGAALAMTMLLGLALIAVTVGVSTRGVRQLGNTGGDARWEAALNVAESGLDITLQTIQVDRDFTTGESLPVFASPEDEREWVVAQADSRSTDEVVSTPNGEFVVVKPLGHEVVYAVGFVPARGAPERRVRVVKAAYTEINESVPWTSGYAMLGGGDVLFWGSAEILDMSGGDGADLHANGELAILKPQNVDGCATSAETEIASYDDCPASPTPEVPIPVIDPRVMYPYAQTVLCPNGQAFGGPAHPTFPDPSPGTPCDGDEVLVSAQGWSSSVSGGVRTWDPSDEDGVYYVAGGNVDGKIGDDKTIDVVRATIIVESLDPTGSCLANSGHFFVTAKSYFETHPSLASMGIALLAQGDIRYRGGATVVGMQLTHEQIDFRGNSGSLGAVIAEDACDAAGSPESSVEMSGNFTLRYPGDNTTPFTVEAAGSDIEVDYWDDL